MPKYTVLYVNWPQLYDGILIGSFSIVQTHLISNQSLKHIFVDYVTIMKSSDVYTHKKSHDFLRINLSLLN